MGSFPSDHKEVNTNMSKGIINNTYTYGELTHHMAGCAKALHGLSFNLPNPGRFLELYIQESMIIPILQMKKLRPKEVR